MAELSDYQEALVETEKQCAELSKEAEHLRMQIGYLATLLMVRGDKRSLPEIVDEAAKATSGRDGDERNG